MSRRIVKTVLCMLLALTARSACAVTLSAGDLVIFPKDNAVKGDIIAAGRELIVRGEVKGDLTGAAGSVTVSGPVRSTVLLAGNDVLISGAVANDAWIAGQSVRLNSSVGDNAYLLGSSVALGENSSVGTDLLAAGNTLSIHGSVGGNVRAAATDITLGGTVGGNVYAEAGGTIHILRGTVIKGRLFYESDEKAVISPGAKILGGVKRSIPAGEKVKPLFWPRIAYSFGSIIAAIVFGILAIGLFPTGTQLVANAVRYSFWQSAGVGLIVLIGIPLACLVAALTLVGMPSASAVFAVFLITAYAASIMVALSLGQAILGRGREGFPSPVLSVVLGAAILAAVGLMPLLGILVKLIAFVIGVGAISVTWWRGRGLRILVRQP